MPRPLLILLVAATPAPLAAAEPVVLEQVVSRHDPNLDLTRARLAVAADGAVYVGSGGKSAGYALRVPLDGTEPSRGGPVGYSLTALAAGPDGTLATAENHFPHRVALWGPSLAPLGSVADFLADDKAGWDAPRDVAAGTGGDFYALDPHRLRVLRVAAPGRLVRALPLDRFGDRPGVPVAVRVWEKGERVVTAWKPDAVRASRFDGTPLWTVRAQPAGESAGGFDLDDDGRLYIATAGDVVRVFDADGKPAGEVRLRPDRARKPYPLSDLRVHKSWLVVRRPDPATLFEVYDRTTGALVRRVPADVEVLTVRYPSAVWTAGRPVPFAVRFDPGGRPSRPHLRAWWRPLGVPEFTELPVKDGSVTPPADAGGLYQVRVTPDVRGRVADFTVDGVVEVRAPEAVGSVSVFTPQNRFYYGQGEEIPVTVVVRAGLPSKVPARVVLRLLDGARVVREEPLELAAGRARFTIPGKQTESLAPGRYVLDARLPQFTTAAQHIEVGPGLPVRPRFHVVQHGDYALGIPAGPRPISLGAIQLPKLADLPETTADHLRRTRRLGINLFVDRLGDTAAALGAIPATATEPGLADRLRADPPAVAPEKAEFEGPVRRTVAGYGAAGVEEQLILMYMDAGLPPGTGADGRPADKLADDILAASGALAGYPGFRGWSWAANWWPAKAGADLARDADEKKRYEAALKGAKETGAWSPVLDTVSDRAFAVPAQAQKRFRNALQTVAPGKLGAMTGPYRLPQSHPPAVFAPADEVDLHYQAEQIQPPFVFGHHVDFYKRPGKPAWAHPEFWNDDGTGGMILPGLFQLAMRGADGVGKSGPVGPGFGGANPDRADPRCGGAGATSVYRAAYEVFRQYGPWLASLEPADRVAVVVSTRMQRVETWDGKIGSAYFDSLFEAYNACLFAHRPASFVFVEDLKPDTLKKFKAVLVVGQRVETDPPLAAALKDAAAAGVRVFHDGTCRPELVKDFAPLGVSFDRVTQDRSAWQDDAAYGRFPRYFKDHAAALGKVLGPVVPPVAGCANPEVLLTERRSGPVRLVWAVNATGPGWEPGLAWRVGRLITQRVPVVEDLKLDVPPGWTVYDVFARRPVTPESRVVRCDLRTLPARLFALLPPGHLAPVPADGPPAESLFGPHVRGLAVSPDGSSAVAGCFDWDHNLYGIDLSDGATTWRAKVGHGFAFAPQAVRGGFAAQGFDLTTAEGYHLYLLGPDGARVRRFALPGLPRAATHWAAAEMIEQPGINGFAVAPDGSWVAAAGDLGLAVWDRDGKLLWSEDWGVGVRKRVRLVAPDPDALVVLDGTTMKGYDARAGHQRFALRLADEGTIRGAVASADGKTLVVHSDAAGGRLFVVRGGRLVRAIPAAADEVAVSPDGSLVVAVHGRQLKAIDPEGGLLWTYTGDDDLRNPRVSPDGKRVAVGSELGTLAVLGRDGAVLAERDLWALPVPAWLPGGDLLAATWMGQVVRFGPDLAPRWERRLTPTETAARGKLLASDPTPTARLGVRGNATPAPLPLTPNLIATTKAAVAITHAPPVPGDPQELANDLALLTDGKPDAPARPWLDWVSLGHAGPGGLGLEVDTFRTRLRVTGVTFVEDPAHPESWQRDVKLQWWDPAAEAWRDGPVMLSDAAVHSHVFERPVEAARFRIVSTDGGPWPAANPRLGELVFHGEVLGPSHPDAGKPVAVLFDEAEGDVAHLGHPSHPFRFRYAGAFSGGRCLELTGPGRAVPSWRPGFGHALPNWDFEIAEHPGPGQYRYLRFAWKASSEKTTGIGLMVGKDYGAGGVAVTVGDAAWKEGVLGEHKAPGGPPAEWAVVTVDLWAAAGGKPLRVQSLALSASGGGALFDRILLGRSVADLDAAK